VIVGLGGAIAKVCAPPVVQELAHPRLRSPLSTLYYTYIFAGSILSGVFTRESMVVFRTRVELTGHSGWPVHAGQLGLACGMPHAACRSVERAGLHL
jgi:hypothetical protein